MWWNVYGPGLPVFGPLFMIGIIGGFIAVVYFVMRGVAGGLRDHSPAEEILKERFARGEISQAQYEQQRRVLGA